MTDPDSTPVIKPSWRHRIRPSLIAILAVIVVGAGVGVYTGVSAFAGMGWYGHRAWSDPARVDENVERMVKHFAVEIDLTDEQQDKLIPLAQAAAMDLLPLHDQMHGTPEDVSNLLTAATIDRVAIEQLRAAKLNAMQDASVRLSQFLADAAEALTVEQRKEVAERITKHRRHHRRDD